jgi:hypothetical protein
MRSFDDARRRAMRNLVGVQKDFQIKIDDIQKKQDALQNEKEELEAELRTLFDLQPSGQNLPSTSTSG